MRKRGCLFFKQYWFSSHSWFYSIKHTTTRNTCQIQFISARSLRDSVVWPRWLGYDKESRKYQLKGGHHVSFDWGKTNVFRVFLSLFKLLLELAVLVIFYFFILSNLPELLCWYSPPCVSLWRFYGSNRVLYLPAILHIFISVIHFPSTLTDVLGSW